MIKKSNSLTGCMDPQPDESVQSFILRVILRFGFIHFKTIQEGQRNEFC